MRRGITSEGIRRIAKVVQAQEESEIRELWVWPGRDLQPAIADEEIQDFLEQTYPLATIHVEAPRGDETEVRVSDGELGRPDLALKVQFTIAKEMSLDSYMEFQDFMEGGEEY